MNRKKFQTPRKLWAVGNLAKQSEAAMYGDLAESKAFKDVWALLLARRDRRPYPAHRLQFIADAICDGDRKYLDQLRAAIDYFGESTVHKSGFRLADPLGYFLGRFARDWENYFAGANLLPTLTELKRYLRIHSVKPPRDDTLRPIWKSALGQKLAPAGKPTKQRAVSVDRFFRRYENRS